MAGAAGSKSRWRCDAVALGLLGSAAILSALLALAPVWTRKPHALGPAAATAAQHLYDSIGLGLFVAIFGLLVWTMLYIAKRSPLRLALRGFGWLLIAGAATGFADRIAVPGLSQYGAGGSVGAWWTLVLAKPWKAPLPDLALALIAFAGLVLAMPGVLTGIAKVAVKLVLRTARGLKRGNDLVARGGDRVIGGLGTLGKTVVELAAKTTAPIIDPPDPTDDKPVSLEAAPPGEPIPIIRHVEPPLTESAEATPSPVRKEPALPVLRLVPKDDAPIPPVAPRSALPDGYRIPSLNLLSDPEAFPVLDHEQKLRERAAQLEKTFVDFGLNVKVVGIHTGPVITQYEIALETGLRLSRVTGLSDDLALNLGVSSVRIVAPLPGRTTVGLEVPNEHRQTVRLKELIQATQPKWSKLKLPIFLGKDVEGRPLVYDMAAMPHLLIAGRTGTGKSVCLNAIIHSFLMTRPPDECRLILIDPKKVEFSDYADIPHLMHPVVTDDKKAEAILAWAIEKMDERYELLRRARVRNIGSYNDLPPEELLRRVDPQTEDERQAVPRKLPYIVLVIDEVGDLLMVMKKEVESHIIRLAQKSRAAGIHLILATQKPTVDVITGLIKSNLPARICFQVASRADSAVVLDEKGAEKLLGHGDMLFLQPGTSSILRAQGTYVDDREIERITGELSQYEANFDDDLLNLEARDGATGDDLLDRLRDRDPVYEQAIDIVVREKRGSTSLLQRALGIGYGRASRLIDFMAEDGIVGGYNGSSARDVLVTSDDWEARKRGA